MFILMTHLHCHRLTVVNKYLSIYKIYRPYISNVDNRPTLLTKMNRLQHYDRKNVVLKLCSVGS